MKAREIDLRRADADYVRAMTTVEIRHDLDNEIIWITVAGALTAERKHHLRTCLGKCIAAGPRAVIVDLTAFDDQTGTAAPLFRAVQDRAERDYGVFLLWVRPAGGSLARRLANPFWRRVLRLCDDRDHALAAALSGPLGPHELRLVLPPDGHAASRARLLVHEACGRWGITRVGAVACRIGFELAHNAVVHAGTELTVTVVRRGRYLRLAVRDGDPKPPAIRPVARPGGPGGPDRPGLPGDGLRFVDRHAAVWGCLRAATGKVVWAVVWLPGAPAAGSPR
jgi:anti-sigma regulatory factor (Ser/Thr protein kinase)